MKIDCRWMKKMLVAGLSLGVFAGCGAPVEDDPESLTKAQARELIESGQAEPGVDYCEREGWYGDGSCDSWCPEPDSDCTVAYDPCAGKVEGDSCTICDPNDPDCNETAVLKVCDASGQCVADTGTDDTCASDAECGADEYCSLPVGACGADPNAAGTCTPIRDDLACPAVYEPVCGCDGMTYGNACAAGLAGVSVDYEGECAPAECTPEECGPAPGVPSYTCEDGVTIAGPGECKRNPEGVCGWEIVTCPEEQPTACGSNAECGADEYCSFPVGVCGADPNTGEAPGVCATILEGVDCPAVYEPVCGCDGVTYSNTCAAGLAGASIDYMGECAPAPACTPQECGPMPGAPNYLCEDGVTVAGPTDRCERNAEGGCGWVFVTCPEEQEPACGSDAECGADEYCSFPVGVCGADPNAAGTCTPIRDDLACPAVYQPVCGCDGKTYGNACEAGLAGASVDYEGECAYDPCAGKMTGDSCTICDPNDPNCNETAVLKVCDASGQCVADTGSTYDPCAGKMEGDLCTICDPNDPNCNETAVVKTCDANGQCKP